MLVDIFLLDVMNSHEGLNSLDDPLGVSVRADDITGTVSKAEPPTKQDGTPAHPYADASQFACRDR